jgi:hypothetical protein
LAASCYYDVDDTATGRRDAIMTDPRLIREAILESGLKKYFIAEKMGISRYSLLLKIDNRRKFKASEIGTLCDLLGLDMAARDRMFFAKNVAD